MVMEPSGFREIARSVTVTYPIPFAFALSLAFTVLSLGGAIISDGVLRWVMVGFGGAGFVFGSALFAACAIWKPNLLRSERQEIRHRIMDVISDSDLGPETVELGRLLLEGEVEKKATGGSRAAADNNGASRGS